MHHHSESCEHDHHGHDHASHGHHHHHALGFTLLLVAAYALVELLGGFWTQSLALIADATHMVSDVAALGLSLGAALAVKYWAGEDSLKARRIESIAALVNGFALLIVAGVVVHEGLERSEDLPEVEGRWTMLIAMGGVLVNSSGLWLLHRQKEHNLNIRAAWLHLLGDLCGSIAVIIAGLCIWLFHAMWADLAACFVVCAFLAWSALVLIRDASRVLQNTLTSVAKR